MVVSGVSDGDRIFFKREKAFIIFNNHHFTRWVLLLWFCLLGFHWNFVGKPCEEFEILLKFCGIQVHAALSWCSVRAVCGKDRGNQRLNPDSGLSTKVLLAILFACKWTNINRALECQRVKPFFFVCPRLFWNCHLVHTAYAWLLILSVILLCF